MGSADVRSARPAGSAQEVFGASLRLGLTSFGGPIAHLGYFRREYVERRRWLDDATFADLVALCQLLPGPASTELGIAIGTRRAGVLGGMASWIGFTLPSALALVLFGFLTGSVDLSSSGWVHGLKLAAVAVVGQAVIAMARTLSPDWRRRLLSLLAAGVALAWTVPLAQVAIIAGGAVVGRFMLTGPMPPAGRSEPSPVSRRFGLACLLVFAGLLVGLPVLGSIVADTSVAFIDAFYRAGALVFGGGHVVLPLLHATVAVPGWVTDDQFLAGYGAAQAVPGPLFAFAGYLGAVSATAQTGVFGAALALGAIFLPSFLLVFGALPFWDALRAAAGFRRALAGTSAAVVGLLLAALYTPVATSAVAGPLDVVIVAAALGSLLTGRLPPIAIVVLCAVAGGLLGR
jgi:chromate transporter